MRKLKYLTFSFVLLISLTATGPSFNVSARSPGATSPTLGSAGSFSVLAASAVTNIPISLISGDVGLSPAAGTNYAGLTPAEVGGTIYAVDSTGPAGVAGNNAALLTSAQNANIAAFGFLDQICDQPAYQFGAGVVDLAGANLGPGVYCADAFLLTGNLTLSGSGVWIFKSASTLTTGVGSSVTGGDPCNVWWRFVSSVGDIGADSTMIGNILALTSINLEAGATLNGRVLAQTGAVTLNTNTITGPTCAAAPVVSSGSGGGGGRARATAAALARISGLPNTGGAPIRDEDFPWGPVSVVAALSAIALVLGIRAYRRAHLSN